MESNPAPHFINEAQPMTTTKEASPLSWPENWPRTRPQDQKPMNVWKKNANQYREALFKELERMGSPSFVVTTNIPISVRGSLVGPEPRDPGVAVYFNRAHKASFGWQDALGLTQPYPTETDIQEAFKRLARRHHPDAGGDIAMFQALATHRDNALRWLRQQEKREFGFVIACDQFKEVRLNLAAILMTLRAIRQIERCGTSALLERAFAGFEAPLLTASAGGAA